MFAPAYALNSSETMDDSGQYSSLGDPIKRHMEDLQEEDPQEEDPAPLDHQTQQSLFDQRRRRNHALENYQMQLMLLESQNKKRLLMARQEQDNLGRNRAPGQ